MRAILTVLVVFLLAASSAPPRYLVTWATEARQQPAALVGHDVLAVFDISAGADFGKLVAYVPSPIHAQVAHHTNEVMPANHRLFANDFPADQSQIFDVSDVRHPRLAQSFSDAAGYTHLHSFATLAGGNVLATYQIKGNADEPGALVELDSRGNVLKATSAAAPGIDENVRPYGLVAIESLDRVVTTSAPMPPLTTKAPTSVVQIWRLSDLKLLETIPLSQPPFTTKGATYSDDALLLPDGKTVLVKTSTCGLFALTGIASTTPQVRYVYDFGARGCSGVPVVAGHYWIEAEMSAHALTALDISDAMHPVEVSHLYLGPKAAPHWLSIDGGNTIVITGFGSLLNRISFATIDPRSGKLTLASRSIDLNRSWPDGWNGPLVAHGSVFYR